MSPRRSSYATTAAVVAVAIVGAAAAAIASIVFLGGPQVADSNETGSGSPAAVLATGNSDSDGGYDSAPSMPLSSSPLPSNSNNTAAKDGGSGKAHSSLQGIVYTAKFECGTIAGNEGPLRPGHYDTDIGIFNKQRFPVKVLWNAAVTGGSDTNAILQTLQPQSAVGVVCKDIRNLFPAGQGNNNSSSFVEGFVFIEVPLDPHLLGELSDEGSIIVGGAGGQGEQEEMDLLDVQIFYTANALDTLPHEVLVDKIAFTIVSDPSGRIPALMLAKTLDVSLPSSLNEISDPELKVKKALAQKYGLSEGELAGLSIRIESVGIGVGTMIDDHAISLSRVPPQASRGGQ